MNAHGELNELEQFKAIIHNLHFVLCLIILSLEKEAKERRVRDRGDERGADGKKAKSASQLAVFLHSKKSEKCWGGFYIIFFAVIPAFSVRVPVHSVGEEMIIRVADIQI